jgi:hypothetical protein
MFSKSLGALIALLGSLTVFVATNSGAATPNGKVLLAQALADASQKSSMTISGTLSASGNVVSISGGFTPIANGGVTTEKGLGSSEEIQPNGAHFAFVKASSIAALGTILEVKHPKSNEINVWYRITSKDPRFADIVGDGAETVAQTFSFSPIGWSRSATYEGTVVLKGVRVFKLNAAANLFVQNKGFGKETLYVTDSTHPLPFALTGPVGSSGLIYFSGWNSTTITIPSAKADLPS